MRIVHAPNPTGTGHNMRALAIAMQLRSQHPGVDQTVLLGSAQDTFGPLFAEAGVAVVDTAPRATNNTALRGHLPSRLDWDGMVAGYLVPAFLDADRVLRLLGYFRDARADLIVGDYNPAAGIAAGFAGLPHVMVTERFNFSLVDVTNDELLAGGAEVAADELDRARTALDSVFRSITSQAAAVLTDKPPLPELDSDAAFRALQDAGRGHFVGPMIRPLPSGDAAAEGRGARARLGLGDGPVVVATVGGTTMRMANKQALVDCYLATYQLLRERYDDLQMVLIGRERLDTPPGVHSFSYIPDWMPLIRDAALLLVPPGWITVTEICALGIPAVFVLSSYGEYHEIEPFSRLRSLGLATQLGTDAGALAERAGRLLDSPAERRQLRERYRAIAPDPHGARRAAEIIGALF